MKVLKTKKELQALANKSGYWYLASPYSKWEDLDLASNLVAHYQARIMGMGVIAMSPIPGSHAVTVQGPFAGDWHTWAQLDEALIANPLCKGMLIAGMDGWDESVGVTAERGICLKHEKTVYLLDAELLDDL